MRASVAAPRRRSLPRHKKVPHPQLRAGIFSEQNRRFCFAFLFLAAFLFGYFPGIAVGHDGHSLIGQQLADYYMDSGNFATGSQLFRSQMANAFLQLMAIFLSGFSALGSGFLVLLFVGKGSFLGFCAANVLAADGTHGLITYWGISCLPNLLFLLLYLWLASYAVLLSNCLFQSTFQGGAPRGQIAAHLRRLSVRFGISLLLSGVLSLLCSGVILLVLRLGGG